MRTNTKFALLIAYLMLAAMVLLVQACGQPAAKDQGCPSDTFLANSTDLITPSPSVDYVGLSTNAFPFSGGPVNFTPVTFEVKDSTGAPRNNICLFAYTGDTYSSGFGPYWYSDQSYLTPVVGVGPFNARVIVTSDTGVATVFWSTAVLPPADAVTSTTTGSTTSYKAGKDITGTSFIHVYSGTQDAIFNVNWTVQGQPTP